MHLLADATICRSKRFLWALSLLINLLLLDTISEWNYPTHCVKLLENSIENTDFLISSVYCWQRRSQERRCVCHCIPTLNVEVSYFIEVTECIFVTLFFCILFVTRAVYKRELIRINYKVLLCIITKKIWGGSHYRLLGLMSTR